MPQNSHKHHFIPAFYTRQWAGDDGRLTVWSKPHRYIIERRKHPEAVGWEDHLYSFEDLPLGTQEWFEDHFLKHVDNLASDALRKMEKHRTTHLSARERSAWTRFIITLRYRHPDVLKEIRENISLVWRRQLDQGVSNYESKPEAVQFPSYEEYLASLTSETHAHVHSRLLRGLMDNEKIGNRINNMYWQVYEIAGVFDLLTSDWPVELHLGAPPRYIALPIGPRTLFVAAEDVDIHRVLASADSYKLVVRSNKLVVEQARRFVFSIDEKQSRFIENRMSRNMEPAPFYPSSVYDLPSRP